MLLRWLPGNRLSLRPRITVTGNSGVAVFDRLLSPFFGFSDPAGLVSVSFLNLGSAGTDVVTNYALDNT